MKRAIYLDDRERDLTRRVFAIVGKELEGSGIGDMGRFAVNWASKEVKDLGKKFDEPEEQPMADEFYCEECGQIMANDTDWGAECGHKPCPLLSVCNKNSTPSRKVGHEPQGRGGPDTDDQAVPGSTSSVSEQGKTNA